ncbi:hypothetical protein ACFLY8_02290 [Halobacteriota archaeon]
MQKNLTEVFRLVLPASGFIEVSKLAVYMGCSVNSLKASIKREHIPVIKLGLKWLICLEDLKDKMSKVGQTQK